MIVRVLKNIRAIFRSDLQSMERRLDAFDGHGQPGGATLADRVTRLESAVALGAAEQGNRLYELCRQILEQRRVLLERENSRPEISLGAARIAGAIELEEAEKRLAQLAPAAYRAWRPLVDVNAQAYAGFPVDSCSVKSHPLGELFRCFVRAYWRGRALDIGCGPQPVPWYLEGYPLDLLHGIDPLGTPADHPFHFVRGVAEFLPWADDQFGLVVVGTSLDHVLLLDRALREIWRVLDKSGGRALVWVSFQAGSPEYRPYEQNVAPIDKYHLFHFDKPWFERTIGGLFTVEERFEFAWPHTSAFYALAPLGSPMREQRRP